MWGGDCCSIWSLMCIGGGQRQNIIWVSPPVTISISQVSVSGINDMYISQIRSFENIFLHEVFHGFLYEIVDGLFICIQTFYLLLKFHQWSCVSASVVVTLPQLLMATIPNATKNWREWGFYQYTDENPDISHNRRMLSWAMMEVFLESRHMCAQWHVESEEHSTWTRRRELQKTVRRFRACEWQTHETCYLNLNWNLRLLGLSRYHTAFESKLLWCFSFFGEDPNLVIQDCDLRPCLWPCHRGLCAPPQGCCACS